MAGADPLMTEGGYDELVRAVPRIGRLVGHVHVIMAFPTPGEITLVIAWKQRLIDMRAATVMEARVHEALAPDVPVGVLLHVRSV